MTRCCLEFNKCFFDGKRVCEVDHSSFEASLCVLYDTVMKELIGPVDIASGPLSNVNSQMSGGDRVTRTDKDFSVGIFLGSVK